MFEWLGGILSGIGEAIGSVFNTLGEQVTAAVWDSMLQWIYKTVYGACASFCSMMGSMGAELFDISWVQATIRLFTLLGWALFIVGSCVAVFDTAVDYQEGRASIKSTAINVLKGFFFASLIGVLPVELYKFSVSLQSIYLQGLATSASEQTLHLSEETLSVLEGTFKLLDTAHADFLNLLGLFAFSYCIVHVFFFSVKRGGILLIQMAVGAMYMFSVPRGYTDGANQWVKQVIAICLTAFLQTIMLFLGILTMQTNMVLGLGVMFAAKEVPRIAQQFGLDSSVRVNMMSVVHATSAAVNMTRQIIRAV